MPNYLKRTGRDVTDDILVRVPEAEKGLSRAAGPASKRLGIDRGSIPSVAAPLEGQMMIQYADEAVGSTPVSPDVGSTFIGERPYYFSNREWRTFFLGSGLNPARGQYKDATVTVPAGSSIQASFTLVSGGVLDLTDPQNPTVLVRGVYHVSVDALGGSGWTADSSLGTVLWFGGPIPFNGAFQEHIASAAGDMPAMTLSGMELMNAGQSFNVQLFNNDSVDHDVTVDPIVVVRVYQY